MESTNLATNLAMPSNETELAWPTHAITLHRPWAYAIAFLGKDYENRIWNCWLKPGESIAIHAGLAYDKLGEAWIKRNFPDAYIPHKDDQPTGIIAVSLFGGNKDSGGDSKWFNGPIGWHLPCTLALKKRVACPGQQKLWKIPGEARPRLKAAMEDLGCKL